MIFTQCIRKNGRKFNYFEMNCSRSEEGSCRFRGREALPLSCFRFLRVASRGWAWMGEGEGEEEGEGEDIACQMEEKREKKSRFLHLHTVF